MQTQSSLLHLGSLCVARTTMQRQRNAVWCSGNGVACCAREDWVGGSTPARMQQLPAEAHWQAGPIGLTVAQQHVAAKAPGSVEW